MLLLLLPALAGPDAFPELRDCTAAGNDTQLAINLCSGRSARAHEALLTVYELRIGWRGDEQAFTRAAEAFDAFLTARCTYLGSFWEGGSGQPMIVSGCGVESRLERLERLEILLGDPDLKILPLAEADAALNATWKAKAKGDPELLKVQRAWLAYRDAQCAWEESFHPKSQEKCLAWHTEKRTAQLEKDVER